MIEQNSGKEQQCDERDGWCPIGTTDKLRDMISAMIKKVVLEQKPGMEYPVSVQDHKPCPVCDPHVRS